MSCTNIMRSDEKCISSCLSSGLLSGDAGDDNTSSPATPDSRDVSASGDDILVEFRHHGCRTHVKDRGYAWVILVASFFCQVIGVGSALSAGVFTPTLLKTFKGSREAVAWVGSLHAGLVFFAGPAAGILADRFGYRRVIIAGSLLASSGVGLSSCSTHVWMLYVTYGFMGGVGICMTYIPSVTLLANYFERWKYVAFSVSATGVGIGTLILPQCIQWLLNDYGWRGAYILTAGFLLQLSICGAVMRDPPICRHKAKNIHSISIKQELAILTKFKFNLFLLNNYLFNFGSLIVFVFIADYASLKGLQADHGTYLISIVGVSNGVGRVVNTLFAFCGCDRTYIYIFSCTLSGISICLMNIPCASSAHWFVLASSCCALYGGLFGVQLGNLAIITHNLAGVERLNSAFGMVMLMNGAGAVTGPPVAGLLYRVAGGYEAAYYVAGGSVILAGVLLIPLLTSSNVMSVSSGSSTHSGSGSSMPPAYDKRPDIGDIVMASIPNLNKLFISRQSDNVAHSDTNIKTLYVKEMLPFKSASYHALTPSA